MLPGAYLAYSALLAKGSMSAPPLDLESAFWGLWHFSGKESFSRLFSEKSVLNHILRLKSNNFTLVTTTFSVNRC